MTAFLQNSKQQRNKIGEKKDDEGIEMICSGYAFHLIELLYLPFGTQPNLNWPGKYIHKVKNIKFIHTNNSI